MDRERKNKEFPREEIERGILKHLEILVSFVDLLRLDPGIEIEHIESDRLLRSWALAVQAYSAFVDEYLEVVQRLKSRDDLGRSVGPGK